ncbi:uncharacterized protein ARMOST_08730 [Armillaria ostoyae]|uniref:Uncharacterized protein n=1 Tax=Armillaria ostoyae TaxID=47428 RepID=A0A284R9F0_ARMOS|nr:uncharacterized protein ARMOST_08730 [Armillaria ostoyae]
MLPMQEKAVPVRGPITAQCTGTGYVVVRHVPGASEDYLTPQPPDPAILGEKPHTNCADDSHVEFRVSAYLGGALVAYFGNWWGDESADEDVDHFERGRGEDGMDLRVVGRVGGKGVDCGGLLGRGSGAWMSGKALAYMALGKDVDWLPARFAKVGKGKHRVLIRIYVGISEQSIPRLRALAHPLLPVISILPPDPTARAYETAPISIAGIQSLFRPFALGSLPSDAMPSVRLIKMLPLPHTTYNALQISRWPRAPIDIQG